MKLIEYLPEDYVKSAAVVELQESVEGVWLQMEADAQEVEKQLFIDTATWGLALWERIYGIETELEKPIEERRSVVKAKRRGAGTTTVEMIKNVSESFVNGEVAVEEHNSEYRFDIIMLSVIGIPPNMQDFKKIIEEIKPAHLNYAIIIKYNTWGMAKAAITWGRAKQRVWKDMKEVAF